MGIFRNIGISILKNKNKEEIIPESNIDRKADDSISKAIIDDPIQKLSIEQLRIKHEKRLKGTLKKKPVSHSDISGTHGYFKSKLEKMGPDKNLSLDGLSEESIIEGLDSYWKAHSLTNSPHKEDSLTAMVHELHQLELSWKIDKDIHQKLSKEIEKKEEAIRSKVKKLKAHLSKEKQLAPETQAFVMGSQKIYSISGLRSALEGLAEENYNNYVCDDKNDFSNWVNDVFGFSHLADVIRKARSKDECICILDSYLRKY